MSDRSRYKAETFIEAIPGTGGLISAIARKVGCEWHTAKKYVDEYPTIRQAYEAELESVKDLSEAVVINNIRAGYRQQQNSQYTQQVDATDARWFLGMKAQERGYVGKSKVEHSGRVDIKGVNFDDGD